MSLFVIIVVAFLPPLLWILIRVSFRLIAGLKKNSINAFFSFA